ncbi:hypothetical protein [Agrobacterium sp. Azo12]|uniref:hypothetical protein n=1 Tax=Agrobacterium sp. Azo12 TaxID=3031129 RepID=UPI0023D8115E|nr:hypothetical protein [Agrobacterium sp. Azo12]MDO5897897.1 hypothetical protein [Agrobacterium sp. Azo12]
MKKIFTLMNAAVLVTVLYVGFVGYEAYNQQITGKWVEQNNLNELGDFLAGLFAPLAFFWLIITVLIQGKELALTRQELADNRKVMQEQADATKAHKEFVEQQTSIMKQQADLAVEAHNKNLQVALYDKRVAFYSKLRKYADLDIGVLHREATYIDFLHLNIEVQALFGKSSPPSLWVNHLTEILQVLTSGATLDEEQNIEISWFENTVVSTYEGHFLPYLKLVD